MKKVFEEITWYALGRKGHTHKQKHGYLKENKNVTKVQKLLSREILISEYYLEKYKNLK